MEKIFDADFWNERYESQNIGWDIGTISTPLKDYFDQLEDRSMSILIPGAGNAYEAEYLVGLGFENVSIVDFAPNPLSDFKQRNPSFPDERLLLKDFFELEGEYDLIIEQTFFCALDPSSRTKYTKKMSELLSQNGKLVGVLFNRHFDEGPPFGGNKEEYLTYFEDEFIVRKMEDCYNSILPRQGSELFIQLQKK